MKFLVVVSCLLATAFAKPGGVVAPVAYNAVAPSSFGYSYSSHVAAPVAYSAHSVAAPVAYSAHSVAAPVAYSAHSVAAPVAYSAHSVAAPVAYAAHSVAAPVAYSAHLVAAPVAYSAHSVAAPVAYAAHSVAAPVAYAAHSVAAPVAYSADAVAAPVAYSTHSVVAPVAHSAVVALEKTQYHAQDELGQAAYGHSEAFQTHNAVQDAAGNKIGSYSYVAPDGQVVATSYVADALGYRVASNAAPLESAEIVAARAAHLHEVEVVKHRNRRSPGFVYAAHPYAYNTPYAYHGISPVAHSAYSAHVVSAPHAYSYRYY